MIPVICDACLNRFEVTDDAAGTTVFCPKCRAKNGVPAADAAAPPAPTATPGRAAGEELLLRARPAMFRARPLTFTALLLISLAGLGGGGFLLATGQLPFGLTAVACSLFGLVPLGIWKVYTMGTSLEVTNKRTIWYRGLLSKASSEVRHNDVKNFQVDQTFLNRILGIGAIGLSSAGQEDVEIRVKDLPNPYQIRDLIDRHRKM
jgi:hypothetical protein